MEFTETSLFLLLFNEFTPWGHSRKSRINLGFSRKIHGDPPLGKAVLIPANPAQVPASALTGKAPSIPTVSEGFLASSWCPTDADSGI